MPEESDSSLVEMTWRHDLLFFVLFFAVGSMASRVVTLVFDDVPDRWSRTLLDGVVIATVLVLGSRWSRRRESRGRAD